MRKKTHAPMAQTSFTDEIIVDNFAGGGGASTGIELAAGRPVTIAINHNPAAILLHKTNHPYTEHLQASVWDVDPVEVCRGRPVGLLWASPDCRHFSKAKGASLVDRKIRGLAWIVLRWAGTVRPRVIMLENVEEFQTWGPVRKGKPVKKHIGRTFRQFISQLRDLGYAVEHRELVAADYGAPTTRKRFVLIARCDGQPVVWPEATHGPRDSEAVKSGKLKPWRSAAEIIDWSVPGYSVFASKSEIKEKYGVNAVRPLAKNTLRRIIRGVDKYTIKSGQPFIVPMGYGERPGQAARVNDINDPVSTVVAKDKFGLCQPIVAPFSVECNHGGDSHTRSAADPVNTVTRKYTGGVCESIITPFTLNNTGWSVGADCGNPVPTIRTAGGVFLGAANLIQYHTEQSENVRGQGMGDPIMTVDSSNRYGLAAVNLTEYYGNGNPLDVSKPMHTVTSRDREAVVMAHVSEFRNASIGRDPRDPAGTITSHDHEGVAAAHMVKFKGQEIGTDPAEPLPTVCAKSGSGGFARCFAVLVKANSRENLGNWPQIRALLNEHCGYSLGDDDIILLLIGGVYFYISDITLRMLTPRELYRAMGFPDDYIIDRDWQGNEYKKTDQVARCGNAVCPALAEALVRANLPEWCGTKITTMAQLNEAVAV